MYADRKQWPLENVTARVVYDKIEEGDISVPVSGQKPLEQLLTQVTLSGNLSPEQVKRLTEIAERCPIHKMLARAFTMLTEVTVVPIS